MYTNVLVSSYLIFRLLSFPSSMTTKQGLSRYLIGITILALLGVIWYEYYVRKRVPKTSKGYNVNNQWEWRTFIPTSFGNPITLWYLRITTLSTLISLKIGPFQFAIIFIDTHPAQYWVYNDRSVIMMI